MTGNEKIAAVKALVENDAKATDALVMVYLSQAQSDIMLELYRAYGSVPEGAMMPEMYDNLQCDLAARKFLRRGAQAESAHNENGVNRTYASTDDAELLKKVMPYAKVVGTT